VNPGAFFSSAGAVDLVLVLFFVGFFVLGFAQGTIRRLIGILSILFSFLFAASLREPLGQFLGQNWRQFSEQYAYMIGFGAVFLAGTVAFTVIIQGFYKTQPLFEKQRFVDEVLGGLLGLLQATIVLAAVIVILDSFFTIPGIPQNPNELPLLREFWGALDGSNTADLFRERVIPFLFAISGPFIPGSIKQLFPG
jgi:uncharacterized membrane protein required for colicin V production